MVANATMRHGRRKVRYNAMAFQPTQDAVSVTLRWVQDTFQWANVLWFTKGAFSEPDQLILANIIMDAFLAADRNAFPVTVSLLQTEVVDARTQGAPLVISERDAVAGTGGSEPMALNACLLLTLRTALRGRSYRGRLYFSGLKEEEHHNSSWSSGAVASVLSFVDQIRDDTAAAAWTWGVRSGQINGVLRPVAVVTPLLNYEIRSTRVASQRRRLRRP